MRRQPSGAWFALFVSISAAQVASAVADEPVVADAGDIDLFIAKSNGYHTYRIPALLVTAKGTLLAFCEGRKTSKKDDGDIDLLLRRSTDGGMTWEPQRLVHEEGGDGKITIGNPCPVVDLETGTIWLPFCRNNSSVFVTTSTDDGRNWAPPRDITAAVKKP